MKKKSKIVVLISGSGSNLQALLDACATKKLNAEIVAVFCNKADAKGLTRAEQFAIPTHVKIKSQTQTRADYDGELAAEVAAYQPDWIVLAGWMRILTHEFLKHFPHQIINLHPALPGAFAGTQAIERAFAAYQEGAIKETGVMVHWVLDESVDAGPVLAQASVAIYPEDNLTTLTTRIQTLEHQLLVDVLIQLCNY